MTEKKQHTEKINEILKAFRTKEHREKIRQFSHIVIKAEKQGGETMLFAEKRFMLHCVLGTGDFVDDYNNNLACIIWELSEAALWEQMAALFDTEERLETAGDPLLAKAIEFCLEATYSEVAALLRNLEGYLPFVKSVVSEAEKQTGTRVPLSAFFSNADYKKKKLCPSLFDVATAEYNSPKPAKRKYRTKAKAGVEYATPPSIIASPSLRGYQYATSLYQNGEAYLQPVASADNLVFENGTLFFKSPDAPRGLQEMTEAVLQDIKTNEPIETIDTPLLRDFYSIILSEFQKTGGTEVKDVIHLYAPEFAEQLGLGRNISESNINSLVDRAQSFHNVLGVVYSEQYGRRRASLFPVLNFEGYDTATNTVSFSSPYLNMVIRTVYNDAIRRDKKGEPYLKSDGTPQLKAWNSYLVKSSIVKERNKAAVENVFIICSVIEQAGKNVPNISAREIINRNPQLRKRLETSSNPNALLKTTFKKTWELLDSATLLRERYKDIVLPDPENPASIPTKKALGTVFCFRHNGKKNE